MPVFSDVLTYHVLKGTVWSASLSDGMTAPTVEGKSVTIKVGNSKSQLLTPMPEHSATLKDLIYYFNIHKACIQVFIARCM